MKATAVLLNYKRPDEIKQIQAELEKQTDFIDEIIIWDNSTVNICGYGRYLGALEAKNETIYTQDDDCIIHNIPELFSLYDGTQIINNMIEGHLKGHASMNHTLPGWGMLFDRSWIKCLNKYIHIYGMDELFFRDTGRLFTGLFGKYHSILGDIQQLPSSGGSMALHQQKGHLDYREKVIKRIHRIGKK